MPPFRFPPSPTLGDSSFRWFVGLSPDDPIWDPTVFTKNRERLQEGDVFQKFMAKLLKHEKVKPLLSDEHFSVDGTLIEAWASHKSFKPKRAKKDDDGSNFHGQLRVPSRMWLEFG
jgi:transposase